jgi:hypothetical protein
MTKKLIETRVCPACLGARPDFDARKKFNPPCPHCQSTEKPHKPVPQKRGPKPKKKIVKPVIKIPNEPKNPQELTIAPEIIDNIERIKLKEQLTLKELKFIELYLTGDLTVDKAMELAGYGEYSKDWRYKLSQKIIIKYESQAGDHRKIFRDIGAGELAIAQGLLKLATTAKSEMVRLNAWLGLAKCLGLTKEVVEGVQGIKIIINAANGESLQVGVCTPASPVQALPLPTSIKE